MQVTEAILPTAVNTRSWDVQAVTMVALVVVIAVAAPLPADAASPVVLTNNLTGDMVLIAFPQVDFNMGCPSNPPSPWLIQSEAQPVHPVSLSPFLMAKFPVSVRQFSTFLRSAGFSPAYADRKVLQEDVL